MPDELAKLELHERLDAITARLEVIERKLDAALGRSNTADPPDGEVAGPSPVAQ